MKNPTERCCGGPSPRARRGESRFPLLPFLARPDVNKINSPLNQGSAREARLFFLELRDKAVTEGTTLGLSYPSPQADCLHVLRGSLLAHLFAVYLPGISRKARTDHVTLIEIIIFYT